MYQDVKVQKGFIVKHIISASLMFLRWFDSKNWAEVECEPKMSVILELQLWKNNLWDHLIQISPFLPPQLLSGKLRPERWNELLIYLLLLFQFIQIMLGKQLPIFFYSLIFKVN